MALTMFGKKAVSQVSKGTPGLGTMEFLKAAEKGGGKKGAKRVSLGLKGVPGVMKKGVNV